MACGRRAYFCIAVILAFAMTGGQPAAAVAKSYHRVDKISSIVKNDQELNRLTKTVDSFLCLLEDKDFAGLYDFLPVEYTSGVSKDDFVHEAGGRAVLGTVFPVFPGIVDHEIKSTVFLGDGRARVRVALSVFDMLDGVKDQVNDLIWVKEYGVWTCPEWYEKILSKSSHQDSFKEELKKEIMKDEVYDFIRSD
jgi:hypothetical protein